LRWSQEDAFWNKNILSAEKFRKQFDQLEMKMKEGGGHGLQAGGIRGETERNRAIREGKELARKEFGYGGAGVGLSHDVHPGKVEPGAGEGLDCKVIDGSTVEVDEAG
jgi:hypothetical protein